MRICLLRKSYFTFRGVESDSLDLLGKTVYEHMMDELDAEREEGDGERVVLYPVYPFLTKDRLFTYLDEREESYIFPGGYVLRGEMKLSQIPRKNADMLGRGLFTLSDYAEYLAMAREKSASCHLKRGVLVERGAEVSFLAEIGAGSIIGSGVRIKGRCVIDENVELKGSCEIVDSHIGRGTVVNNSVILSSSVGADCVLGPNAYLRPGTVLSDGCRVGDFVELKNAHVGRKSKIAHLAYVGDAVLGENVNVGCGVIFVNYNGREKSLTKVGNDCFIGSNCNLIAPLEIGDGAYIAAGTTLTQNLNQGDFCIGRCRETVKSGRVSLYQPRKE